MRDSWLGRDSVFSRVQVRVITSPQHHNANLPQGKVDLPKAAFGVDSSLLLLICQDGLMRGLFQGGGGIGVSDPKIQFSKTHFFHWKIHSNLRGSPR